jgi:hypothetical protein
VVTPLPGCVGEPLTAEELPDGGFAPITVDLRDNTLSVSGSARRFLSCSVASAGFGRGQVGVGALHGTITVASLLATR